MKQKTKRYAARLLCVLALSMSLTTAAFAADPPEPAPANGVPAKSQALWGGEEQGSGVRPCQQAGPNGADFATTSYPTAVTRSEDGGEIRKMYDLGPEDDPAGIPRSDFEQDGFRYTLVDLLKQELPEQESRQHTETVTLESKDKDMASVLALLPQEREFITDDGLEGILTLQLDTVDVEVSGYGSSTREVSATRSYPGLASQDTANIPKTIQDGGRTLTLQDIDWQTDNTASMDGYAMGDRYTAVATYTGSATSSYVKGYTVTADYAGTVSRINLNKIRYVAIFEGEALGPAPTEGPSDTPAPDPTAPTEQDSPTGGKNGLLPVAAVVVVVLGAGTFLVIKRRKGW